MDEQERAQRRVTFDRVALLYDRARPGYPEELVSDALAESRIPAGGRILEIGCGTGKATVLFARRGYRMLCVELGAKLAAVARRNVGEHPEVEFYVGAFEDWPVEAGAFDLAIAAQAFHWLDAQAALPKIAAALRPGGSIALFWNNDDFFAAAQEVYQRETPELVKRHVASVSADAAQDWVPEEIDKSGLFGPVDIHRYAWEIEYDAATYTALLATYSDHQLLDAGQRAALFNGITELIDGRFGRRIVKSYRTLLYLAQKQ